MKPIASGVLAAVLAVSLTACGNSYTDNHSDSKCGKTICVNSPSILCVIETHTLHMSFEVTVASGRKQADYVIRGNTGLNGSYTVFEGSPPRRETGPVPDNGRLFNAAIVDVFEGNDRVRRLEVDPDDLC